MTRTNEQLTRIYRHYADESCANVEKGGTNLLIACGYLDHMKAVLDALMGNDELDNDAMLQVIELLDMLETGVIDVSR